MIDDIRPAKPAGEPSLQPKPTSVPKAETPQLIQSTGGPAPLAKLNPQPIPAAPAPQVEPVVLEHITFEPSTPAKKRFKWPLSKPQTIIMSAIFVLLIGGGVSAAVFNKPEKAAVAPVVTKKVIKKEPPKPTTVASALSGIQIAPELNTRPVIGVMVENSPNARPQSGLNQAGIVFEAIAEGGVTRFLALYQENQPGNVGPIRSARPYFVSWAMGYDAAYAHVGGSPDALQKIREWGVKDLDQFQNSGAYRRITTRYAPHNVYSGVDGLAQLAAGKGYTTSTFTGFPRVAKESPAAVPTAKAIQMKISGPTYNVGYDYDAPTNSYKRQMAGTPHLDADTNSQLNPKVVIGLVVPYGLEANRFHSTYATIGSGVAYVFQDGAVVQGTWTKTANNAPLTITGPDGSALALNAGQTWITAVATQGAVTYTP